jgi:glycosyltransferase involved in cell wall biosynthesis
MEGLLPILQPGSGCSYHRLSLPLRDMGYKDEDFLGRNLFEEIQKCKILWFNRTPGNLSAEGLTLLKEQYGFKVVMDLDDHWILHPKHNLGRLWRISDMEKAIPAFLKIADEVIVTTSLLADKVKAINPNVHVIPNALPYDTGQFINARIESEYMRFLYAGGGSHLHDIKQIEIPLLKTNNNPAFKKAQFILCGYHAVEGHPESAIEWNKMEHAFNSNNRLRNYVRRTTLPLEQYMTHYHNADVVVIPLENNTFNPFKSNLKILEAGANNSAVIASDVEPYAPFPDRSLIMYGRNAKTWYEHLDYCIKNHNFVVEKGKALGEFVRKNYLLSKVNEYRKQLFQSLLNESAGDEWLMPAPITQ